MTQNCAECGLAKTARQLNADSKCKECERKDKDANTGEQNSDDFWGKMNSLFDRKLDSLEEKMTPSKRS